MLQFQLVVVHLALVIALLWWNSSSVLLAQAAPEVGEGSWWLSHNCSSLGILSHTVRRTLEYPNTVGRCRIRFDSVRAKEEPQEERDANCMALGKQTEWGLTPIFTTSPKHLGISCVLKHCPVDREFLKRERRWWKGRKQTSLTLEGKFNYSSYNNSMRKLKLSEAVRRSLGEDHLHKNDKLKEMD